MTKPSWFSVRAAKAFGAPAEILIYDEIGLFGISAADFVAALKTLDSPSEITVRINTPGGEVFAGIAIFNALKRHPAFVRVIVDGVAASIGSLVAMAGDRIEMPENAMMMIHDPAGIVLGTSEDMRAFADALDKMRDAMVTTYASRSGLDRERIVELMNAETWLSASEAKDIGFADEVTAPVKIAAKFDLLAKFKAPPKALQRPSRAQREDEIMSKTPEEIAREAAEKVAADAKAKSEAEAKAKVEAEAKAKADADAAKAKSEAEAKTKAELDAKAKSEAEAASDPAAILDLCVIAGASVAQAREYITAKTSVAQVREALAKAKVEKSNTTELETQPAQAVVNAGWDAAVAKVNSQHGVPARK